MNNKWWWYNKFFDFGAKMTPTRKKIIDILGNTQEHLSVEDIFKKALKTNPEIGLTTVYRTLDLLEQMGIAQKFVFGDGKARYELINNPKNKERHHHLVCVRCKTIIDFSDFLNEESKLINSTEIKLLKKYNFKIINHMTYFYGLCGKCQNFF